MRVGILAIQHESNTFLDAPTTLEDFRRDTLLTGGAVRDASRAAHHEVGGFFEGLQNEGLEAAPLLLALAIPSGPVTPGAFAVLNELIQLQLEQAGPLDGLLVAPHGAGVCAAEPDMDGAWLTLVRKQVGRIPIVCTLDLHANVSPRMILACDATIGYRTNPHLDQRETGRKAARLLSQALRGEVRLTQALCRPPVAISIDRQHTAEEPCQSLYAVLDDHLSQPGVLANTVFHGFPYADVAEMGSSFVVVTDGDVDLARREASWLGSWLVERRHEFECGLLSVEQALEEIQRKSQPRTCLLDVGDNVGGGSPADGTVLAHALYRHPCGLSFVCLLDPESAEQAISTGPGARVTLAMGGKTDDRHGPPLEVDVEVVSIHNGLFEESQVRHGGRVGFAMGPSAVVRTDRGLTILLNSRRTPPFSLGMLTSCGLDPSAFRVLVAKGVNAPIAAYREVCARFLRVDTPGVTCANMTRLSFQHRRRPLFPFEEDVALSDDDTTVRPAAGS